MNIETKLTDKEIEVWLKNRLGEGNRFEQFNRQFCKDFGDYVNAKTKRVIAEWLMNYIDINLEEIIPGDKYTLFFIPNDKLKAIKKWALGK